ncbi:squalene-hopene/tetraprenyl-beta-curcumene cyclase [Rhodothalassium salexigens DSM 2132]|uniref:Squalene-hopene/tetraprenyl-beta-curcumene cyclase n=1 Tax=Rhodothalassium salexigens DSM 2132 TaxID=1188247 RepID=A0A4R2PF00_RHOSA|nr:squalene--hopene cyclase [Rhodothalassium salexigens]MBB4211855.1 squalene-hopene/tetraprenyl-beta-curcumene cyclase [Rhodothalassium salexigens DSM 2132]MBK1638848.1 squalene--hopene cyclase [Rhodothalassium salexigens DSM 2132]TCP33849.1 squalene-hopene/tetraprenyl-beta-curcumene cyclase [Rhodothalassium salexigens DSM 2132]
MPEGTVPVSGLHARIDSAIDRAVDWSAARQTPEGYWMARVDTNACMEAQWVLALWVLNQDDHPIMPGLVKGLLDRQRDDGSWEIYHQAPAGDINTTVECYAALRTAGLAADDARLVRARHWIEARGGLRDIRVFTRYWLALIGEWPWRNTPNLTPEVVFIPHEGIPFLSRFSIYNFASWARATMMPLTVLSARRFARPLPADRRLDELFPEGREKYDFGYKRNPPVVSWERFFLGTDRMLHKLQDMGLGLRRETAIRRVIDWIIDHQDADGVWGGIQPPWIYGLIALHAEGYGPDHPVMRKGLDALDDPRWAFERDGGVIVQATVSPVWDTLLTLQAFQETGQDEAQIDRVEKAVDWLMSREVRTAGDWSVKIKGVEPGGWAFELENAHYPDTDDTAVAIMVLAPYRDHPRFKDRGIGAAVDRAIAWLRAMQCSNGGWGAFDKDNDDPFLTKIPFCDFGEVLDPPSVDVTAHILEAFAVAGYGTDDPTVQRALKFLWDQQESDGSWWGRWGVNYVYGTGAVLPALARIGVDMRDERVLKAADYLAATQDADGGWGETCASYMDPSLSGKGEATASQTAWGLMGLLAVGRGQDRKAVERGVGYLLDSQQDGSWHEDQYTGTGFPGYGVGKLIDLKKDKLEDDLNQSTELSRGFMINYHMYRHYFPMTALGRAKDYLRRTPNEPAADAA